MSKFAKDARLFFSWVFDQYILPYWSLVTGKYNSSDNVEKKDGNAEG